MILDITEEQRIELRRALMERKDELEKLKKKAEEKGLHGAVLDILQHVRVIEGGPGSEPGLLQLLLDPATEGAQRRLFGDDQDVDKEIAAGLLDGIEKVAAARIMAALAAALPDGPDEPIDNDALTALIGDDWEDCATEFEGTEYAGFILIDDIWCYLDSGAELAFHYHVGAPAEYVPANGIPALAGDDLLRAAAAIDWPESVDAPQATDVEAVVA